MKTQSSTHKVWKKKYHKELEQKQKKETPRLRERFAEQLNMTQDILSGAMIVTAMGMQKVIVENYKGILEYTGDIIRLQGKQGRVSILGTKLVIECYTDDEMHVSGRIQEIKFLR